MLIHKRDGYLEKIWPYVDKPVIKIITGMRRAGKSFFLLQIIDELKSKGVNEKDILLINKESLDFKFIKNYEDLNTYVKKSKAKYLFIDEVQEIENWEKAIISFFSKGDLDIYLTGSNAHMLSSELATLISGRYIEFPIYTLSFKEFLEFRGSKKETDEKEFERYVKYGGLPALHNLEFEEGIIYPFISSIYSTVLLKDVIEKNEIRNVELLTDIISFVFDNIGNVFSVKKISDYLKSQKIKMGIETIQNYLSYFEAAYIINKVSRFDIKGKRYLEIFEKYFLNDIGIRHAILGYREADISGILENIIFLELKRRGYKVSIGKLDELEVDFIATKEKEKIYVQVCYMLASKEVIERELKPLKERSDNYPKYILSMDTILGGDLEGIKRINIIDFLLN